MNDIRKALPAETADVLRFYDDLLVAMKGSPYNPIWKKGVYPDEEFIKSSIENGEFFVMIKDRQIVAAMALNHSFGGEYEDVKWNVTAEPEEALVIHILAVSIPLNGKGFGREMVQYAVSKARKDGMKAIRLDVYPDNTPAVAAYEHAGFKYIDTRSMCYGDAGLTAFWLYELPVENDYFAESKP